MKLLEYHVRIMKIMKIIEFRARITKLMTILESNLKINKIMKILKFNASIMKIKKILKFASRITKIMKPTIQLEHYKIILREIYKKHENHRITIANHETYKNHTIRYEKL